MGNRGIKEREYCPYAFTNRETKGIKEREYCACAFTKDDKHYTEGEIEISCGHYACSRCISDKNLIYCKICSEFNNNKNIDKKLKSHKREILNELKSNFQKSLDELKRNIGQNGDFLDIQINKAKEDVEIRIESLKNELEEIKLDFCKELDDCRGQFEKKVKTVNDRKYDEYIAKIEISESEDVFNKHVDVLNKLQSDLKHFETRFKIDFNASENNVSKKLIGKLRAPKVKLCKENFNDYYIFDSKYNFGCFLDNGAAYYESNEIIIFDEESWAFNVIPIELLNYYGKFEIKDISVNDKDGIMYIGKRLYIDDLLEL